MSNAILELALKLTQQGWFVFPCHEVPWIDQNGATHRGKEPYWERDLLHGKDDATLDIEQLKVWWARWPNALIGIACEKSGFFAVDIDTHNGQDGFTFWEDLIRVNDGNPVI
jgi:putative DNA primase/helicase